MVLTGAPDRMAYANLLCVSGLSVDRFEHFYWADRAAYDEGKLTGFAFWQKFVRDAGLPRSEKLVEDLNHWDIRLWTTQDPAMVAWQLALKQHGLLTAVLSNMGDAVLENIEREFDWLQRFDVLVWSFQLGIAKPDPEIYRHTLAKLGTRPEETLFIDDKLENIEAARALGMKAIQFFSVEELRADLIAAGLDAVLPLPADE
jgi:putative hydrolase of the HAD superfamily